MAGETVGWPWLYKSKTNDSEGLKEAHQQLVDDEVELADLDFTTDEFQKPVTGFLMYEDQQVKKESPEGADDIIEINYADQMVKLPTFVATNHSIDPCVKAIFIRYVSIIGEIQEIEDCRDKVVLLSVWNPTDRRIVNVYVCMSDITDSLLLVNSVSKLIFEACGKSSVRLERFSLIQSGIVLVSSCSVEERDQREKLELEIARRTKPKSDAETNGTLEADAAGKVKDDDDAEELKPLEEKKMFFTFDEESLCVFDHALSPKPTWDFRFYKESMENAIDVIYVCNETGELEIEQQQTVFYIKSTKKALADDENFSKLSEILRKGMMKPKPQEIFADLRKFVEYFGDSSTSNVKPSNTEDLISKHPPAFQKHSEQWLVNLNNGSHLINTDEDLQFMWFEIEHQLEGCLKEAIPESSIESAGMNPNNVEHLWTAVEDIKDKLLSRNYKMAISNLRGILHIFRATVLKPTANQSEVEILKRIFFLSA